MTALTATRFAPHQMSEQSGQVSDAADRAPRTASPKLKAVDLLGLGAKPQAKASNAPAKAPVNRKAAWLNEPRTARQELSVGQYMRELDHLQRDHFRKEAQKSVLDVSGHEVERVVQLAARLRGRYLAKLLDAAPNPGQPISEAAIREVTRFREMFEEVEKGLDFLKTAMETGDVRIEGIGER